MVSARVKYQSSIAQDDEDTVSRNTTSYKSATQGNSERIVRGAPPPSTTSSRISDWKAKVASQTRMHHEALLSSSPRLRQDDERTQNPPAVQSSSTTGEWYSRLNIEDELMEPEERFDTEPLQSDDEMRPMPTYLQSNTNLTEAMGRLATSPRARFGGSDGLSRIEQLASPAGLVVSKMRSTGSDDDDSLYMKSIDCSSDIERRTPIEPMDKGDQLIEQMRELISVVQEFRGTFQGMERRIENLEGQCHRDDDGPVRSSRNKRLRAMPKRRSKEHKDLARSVREEIESLLHAHSKGSYVSEEEAQRFEQAVKATPGLRCCTTSSFQIDINGGTRNAWNKSAVLVFDEYYLAKKGLPLEEAEKISKAFFARVKSIRTSLTETEKQRIAKGTYLRQYSLYQRRVEAVASSPHLRAHLPLLQVLSIEGMSSDEEDGDGPGAHQTSSVRNPTYRVLTPRWRSRELTMFLHILDAVYLLQRRLDPSKKRGNWPRQRVYDSNHVKLSEKTAFPRNLPINAYSQQWLKGFPNIKLSVNPTARYDFTHSPEVFQFVYSTALSRLGEADFRYLGFPQIPSFFSYPIINWQLEN